MFNLDNITEKDNNKDWPYRKLIIGPYGSGKTNYLLNSVQKDNNIIDKIYLYAKDLEDLKENKQESILTMIHLLLLSILILWIIFFHKLTTIIKEKEKNFNNL